MIRPAELPFTDGGVRRAPLPPPTTTRSGAGVTAPASGCHPAIAHGMNYRRIVGVLLRVGNRQPKLPLSGGGGLAYDKTNKLT